MKKVNLFLAGAAATLVSTVVIVPASIAATKTTPKEVGPVDPVNPISPIEQQIKEQIEKELGNIPSIIVVGTTNLPNNIMLNVDKIPNTLPSEVNETNLKDFIQIDNVNGVNFEVSLKPNGANDVTGELVIIVTSSIGNVIVQKEITIDGFQTEQERAQLKEQQKNILRSELEKINTLETFEVAKNTLPSQVNNQNITDFIKVPVSSNGVSFSIKISETASGSDTSGFVVVTLAGSIGDLTSEKTIIVNGFRIISPEEVQEQINIAADRDIQNELNSISSLEKTSLANNLAWQTAVLSGNATSLVNIPQSKNGVQFSIKYVDGSVHLGLGRFSIILSGSKNGRTISKTIVVTGFPV
ncbi:lipoprotein 17-related variable surface protein [[Mycoplasma] mobile]|uniref:Variable surface protein mvspN n=1 Tax=Mycoplasma mobile (strain ATCC 43663 / 163K / NCTC 11711) TaxID=267748 RepID=Q6KH37_MYCM1|nr:lipoprotein 17-related variable surface protein [[Mycoplasma] mobile]AAT28094.1 variable surface protein mvspN [Mycoplasma mobile 163K]